jgi:hypothetical protein
MLQLALPVLLETSFETRLPQDEGLGVAGLAIQVFSCGADALTFPTSEAYI